VTAQPPQARPFRSTPMLDIVFIALGFGVFAAAILYVAACDRL
jgi:hypothetical protein